ncbi:MAG: N-acetylglucosamine-6-phosphate deacetylase [Actinomycetota bacterium]
MADDMVRSHLLFGADVLTPNGWQEFDLNIVDGVISDAAAPDGSVVDATGLRLVPGYIDLQINGGWGLDLQRDPTTVWALGERLVEVGVTSFLPTLTTNGFSRRREALSAWRTGGPAQGNYLGADPLGWHMEGPWLAPSRHGAHSRELLQPIPREVPTEYNPAHGVRMVTLAPELAGAHDMVEELRGQGVVVAAGHTEATAAQGRVAFDAGVTVGSHLYNAMSGLHHRDPGMAAALLVDNRVYATLIVDGVHVSPEMVALAWQAAAGRIIAVSDAVAFMGTVASGATGDAVRLYDGRLAGSTVGLDMAVRNLVAFTGCGLADAVAAVTEIPARCLGLPDRGRIEIGRRADLVALDDEGQVVMTFVGGRLVWDRR